MNGKQKGSDFERQICKALSLWVSNGKSIDLYWRSAMSGGRATVKRGQVRQAGDITAVAPEGHVLTDVFFIECKAYKTLTLDCFIKWKGTLIDFWDVAVNEAHKYGKIPMLIVKRNNWPILVCMTEDGRRKLGINQAYIILRAGPIVLLKFETMTMIEFKLHEY